MTLFARNLLKCNKTVTTETRTESIINGQSSEVFTLPVTQAAIVKTMRGKAVFDSTNTERVATHEICIVAVRDLSVRFLANSGLTATATNISATQLSTGIVGTMSGADQSAYNVVDAVITVTASNQFTYQMLSDPGTPGTPTAGFTFSYVQDQTITAESWLTLDGKRLKILTVENCCEKDEVLKLMCTERGEGTIIANTA